LTALISPARHSSRYRGILFDLDGVVADSEPFHVQAWIHTCKEYNIHLSPSWFNDWIGRSGIELSSFLIKEYNIPITVRNFILRQHEHFLKLIDGHFSCFPGLKEELELLPGSVPRGIVTSGTRYLAERVIRRLELDSILPLLVTIEDVVLPKPAPEAYTKAVEILDLDPAECLVVEDSPSGIKAAHAAGCYVLGVTNTHSCDYLEEADRVLHTSAEALAWALTVLIP